MSKDIYRVPLLHLLLVKRGVLSSGGDCRSHMGFVAVLGDIHGNKEAWDAVFRSIDRKKDAGVDITHYFCTGDIVGYGPDPRACLQEVYVSAKKSGKWTVVKGNHDNAVASKITSPEAVIGESIGIKGLGGYEGIHWAVRQLCGDYTRIPLDTKPQKPVQGDDDAEKKYRQDVRAWRSSQVEQQTNEAARKAPDYVNSCLSSLVNMLSSQSNGMPLQKRFVNSKELRKYCLENSVAKLDINGIRAAQHCLDKYALGVEDQEVRQYLAGLPAEIKTTVDSGKVQVPVMLVHDNPFEPGDSKYVVAKKAHASSFNHSVDDVFAAWDSKWADVRVIFFGHSHIPGVYSDNGRLLVNPGSVGIPRSDKLEATYALWNPDVEGKDSVEIVRLERAGWRMTRKKMKECALPDKFEHVHAEVS